MKGKFIVIEGTDGSGKTEQFKRLTQGLRKNKISYRLVDFPQYGKPSAYFVEKYLRGEYGQLKEIGPYKASLFYALDRYDVANKISRWLSQGKVVLANRYVGSNLGHQGVKIKSKKVRKTFYRWVEDLEYRILNIPRPDLNIFLHVPARIAYHLVGKQDDRGYLKNKKRDLHTKGISHLICAEKIYLEITKLFPKDFVMIECVPGKKLLTIDEIAEKVWKIVKKRIY